MKTRLTTLADTQVKLLEELVRCYERIPYLEKGDRIKLNHELSEHLSAAAECCGKLVEIDRVSLLTAIANGETP